MTRSEENKMQEFFLKKLKASGHIFENKVGKILQKDFEVRREVPYFDKDEKIVRSVDFEAKIHYPGSFKLKKTKEPALGVLNLIAECKDAKNYGWLFYKDPSAQMTMQNFDYVNWLSHTKKKAGIDFPTLPITPIKDIMYASKHIEFFYKDDNATKGKVKDTKPFIDSAYPISKATNHFLENELRAYNEIFLKRKIKFYPHNQTFTVFQPLIVFGGHLYEVKGEDSEMKLNPIEMVQMKKTYYSDNYKINSGVIHIVTLEGLPKYLELLKEYFNINKEFLKWEEESSKWWTD